MLGILFAPGTVGFIPASARQFCGAINAIPVGGIVTREVVEGPGNAHLAEHREVGVGIGAVGIKERAIPVKQDAADLDCCSSAHVWRDQISRVSMWVYKRESCWIVTQMEGIDP